MVKYIKVICMIKIMFVCHGNICRSPMAEFIMKELVKSKGLEKDFYIASAATSTEEIGNPVYPPVRRILNERGIDCSAKKAVQVKKSDYNDFDYLICMDRNNIRNISRITGPDIQNKIHLLLDYTSSPGDVADPWYTGDFTTALMDIEKGCNGFLGYIKNKNSR